MFSGVLLTLLIRFVSGTLYLSSYLAIMQHAPQLTAKWVYSECKHVLGANIFQQNFRKLLRNSRGAADSDSTVHSVLLLIDFPPPLQFYN